MLRLNEFFLRSKGYGFWPRLVILFALFFISLSLFVVNKRAILENDILVSDASEYYSYLPSALIYHDLDFNFVNDTNNIPSGKITYIKSAIGKPVIKMGMGLAIANSPFFLTAHFYSRLFGYESNGYSLPYYYGIRIASLFYVSLACALLVILLSSFVGFLISLLSVGLILFGTNLLNYIIYQPGMSHAISFSFGVFFIYTMLLWFEQGRARWLYLLALIFGIIVLIRPTNLFIIVFPLFYQVQSVKDLGHRISLFSKLRSFYVAIGLFFLVILPQLIYWKVQTGSFFVSTYGLKGEGFFFLNPQIGKVLFSFRNGWLIYTPIMIFSLLGIIALYNYGRRWFLPVLTYFTLNLFLISSWWCWWFIGYGHRAFIDLYGVLAIPMGYLLFVVLHKSKIVLAFLVPVFLFLIHVNYNQTKLYRSTIIHYDSMTEETWKESWLSKPRSDDYFQKMIHPNYDEAIKGIYYHDETSDFIRNKYKVIEKMVRGANLSLVFHQGDTLLRVLDFENNSTLVSKDVRAVQGVRFFKFDDNFDFLEILNETGIYFADIDTTGLCLKASAWLRSNELNDRKLANLVISAGSNSYYLTYTVNFSIPPINGWYFVSGSMRLGCIKQTTDDVKVYLWKRSDNQVFVDNFIVSVGKL